MNGVAAVTDVPAVAGRVEDAVPGCAHSRRAGVWVQAARYCAVGLINAVVGYCAFHGTLTLLHHSRGAPAAAQVVSTILSTASSFALHRQWTFRSVAAPRAQLARFLVLQVGIFAFSTLAVELAIDGAGLPEKPVWFAVMAVVVGINFVGQRAWVFRSRVRR